LSMSGQGTQYSWYTLKKTPSRMIIEENCSLIRSDAKVVKILDEIMQEFELQSAKGGIAN